MPPCNPTSAHPARDTSPPAATTGHDHDANLERYAQLLVEHAVALRPGQRLDICGELIHREFALRIGEAAYTAGGGEIRYRLIDPLATAQLIRRGDAAQIALYHIESQAWLAEVLRARGAFLVLDGWSDPSLFPTLGHRHPRNHLLFSREANALNFDFTRRTMDQRLCPVVRAVCPTPAWAQQVFPQLPPDQAFARLAALIFRFTHADRRHPLVHAAAAASRFAARRAALDALAIRAVHVRGGGNDLRIVFSSRIRWLGGSVCTAAGQRFFPNVPSFEVFTTPDRNRTEGRLVASRPLRLQDGTYVEGLVLNFRNGRVADFQARCGATAFGRWLDVDDGARHVGEFALVGDDSPIAASGQVFAHTLLDENAAAHLALGYGFTAAFEGSEQLAENAPGVSGPNRSAIHIDIPFGSREVDVVAVESGEGDVPLLVQGRWASRFAS